MGEPKSTSQFIILFHVIYGNGKKTSFLHVKLLRSRIISGPPESPLHDPALTTSLPAHNTWFWNPWGKAIWIAPDFEVLLE